MKSNCESELNPGEDFNIDWCTIVHTCVIAGTDRQRRTESRNSGREVRDAVSEVDCRGAPGEETIGRKVQLE